MPASSKAWHWRWGLPWTPGISLDSASLVQSLNQLCVNVRSRVDGTAWFFTEGGVLLRKASQSVSLTIMNSNKRSEKGCLDEAYL